MGRLLPLAVALVVGACATIDRPAQSKFTPLPPDNGVRTFRYELLGHTAYNDADHEKWLALAIAENHYCPAGYVITDRQSTRVERPLGPDIRKFWTGRCL